MSYRDEILAALERCGPLSMADLIRETGLGRDSLSKTITAMRRSSRRMPKQVRVCEWFRDCLDGRMYPRPIYALGSGPCRARPRRLSAVERTLRYQARKRASAPSVFAYAQTFTRHQAGRSES